MRARDYAKIYRNYISGGTEEDIALANILSEMVKEAKEGDQSKKFAVLDELEEKWTAFCRIIDKEIHSDMVPIIIKALNPQMYDGWMSWKRIINFERNSGRTK